MISKLSNRAVLLAVIVLVFGQAASAADELHEVSWAHPGTSEVARFIVYISPEEGSVARARQIDVGVPASEALGPFRLFSAIVDVGTDEFVAVAAMGRNGLLSPLSVWGPPQPSAPGQPVVVGP